MASEYFCVQQIYLTNHTCNHGSDNCMFVMYYKLRLVEALFNYLFIIILHFVITCKLKLIMNILNMSVLQCILCASERKFFRIYGALQIKKYYY